MIEKRKRAQRSRLGESKCELKQVSQCNGSGTGGATQAKQDYEFKGYGAIGKLYVKSAPLP